MWAQADELSLGGQVTSTTIQDYLNSARHAALEDKHWKQGDEWKVDTDVSFIWEGWVAEGFLHVINALPKVGKTTLFLALFNALGKRNRTFLNFPISIEKKYEVFLVGPDMNRLLWGKAGREAGLLNEDGITPAKWQPIVREVWTEEDQVGLTPEFIEELASKAEESAARGASPIFLFDSYKKLLLFAGDDSEPGTAKFSKRLNLLRAAMTQAGERSGVMPTCIVLNHASLSSSKRSASLAAGGDQAFMGIPDQCISLNWCSGVESAVRTDKRVVMTAEGRTGMMMPAQLLEQFDAGLWMSHGEAGDAEVMAKALDERDRLNGDHAFVFDVISGRTEKGMPTTSGAIAEAIDIRSNGKTSWSQSKINRSLQFLKRRSLIVDHGTESVPGDLGGRPSLCWWSFERELNRPLNREITPAQPLNREKEPSAGGVKSLIPEKSRECESRVKRIVPCHPIGRIVEHNGTGGWEVIEANLADGMHVIRKGQLVARGLRMIDIPLHVDPDEEL